VHHYKVGELEHIHDCRIVDHFINVTEWRKSLPQLPQCGGYVSFEGMVRDVNHGKQVTRLEYETYEMLALKEMRRIAIRAAEKYQLEFVRCIHRQGILEIGEVAVMIQVLSRHRNEAFEGCRFVIDQVKERVPIWKKEFYADGTHDWTRCQHAHHTTDHSHLHASPAGASGHDSPHASV
jgi:molybdopterin synthase catalytic subunit